MDVPTIVNLALQSIGTRTTVTAAELTAANTNEAIQANLAITQTRDNLLRMAPWDCATAMANLQYISSLPGTPENQSVNQNTQWQPGQPAIPWAYEYAYPSDCLRALWIAPQDNTGQTQVPISNAVTGFTPYFKGPPIKFKVGVDLFYSVTAASVVAGGVGYAVGDTIVLALGPVTSAPIGAPAQLQVTSVSGGAITGVSIINTFLNANPDVSGAYFTVQPNPQAQGTTSGSGTGATFDLTWTTSPNNQRVVLCNQEFATLAYVRQITDPNTMDNLFQTAWQNVLAATLCMALTGDKGLANQKIALANGMIVEARSIDANEGLLINDVTPDFIRVRGVIYSDYWWGPSQYDWGNMWTTY